MEQNVFLNRYHLCLGRNGQPIQMHRSPLGQTYRAQDRVSGNKVALSLVMPRPAEPAILRQLERQATAAKRIDQISLPRLFAFGYDDRALMYVSELCEGPTAAAWVAVRGPLTLSAGLQVGLQVATAMHVTGYDALYHPALNPDNILFAAGQADATDWLPIKLLDWFLPAADLAASDAEIDSSVLFASPEQLHDGQLEMASQMYSLGATILFLLTAIPPSSGPGMQPSSALLRGAPRAVRHLLGRMTSVNPEDRPQDPVALAAFLQTCLGHAQRGEMIQRRLALPLVAAGRATKRLFPLESTNKSLAFAAFLLGLASAAAFVFLRPWPEHRTASRKPAVSHLQAIAPNDPALPPAAIGTATAAASRARIANLPGARVGGEPGLTKRPTSVSTPEVAPPAEGPAARIKPAIAQTNESPEVDVASRAPPSSRPPSGPENDSGSAATLGSEPGDATSSSVRQRETKRKMKTVAQRSHHRATQRGRQAGASSDQRKRKGNRLEQEVRRAQAIPSLHVGSSEAELVGTTADGHWILSVADTGERVIVPPPPGFNP